MQNRNIVIILSVLAVLMAVLLTVDLIDISATGSAVPVYVSGSGEAAGDTVMVYGQGKVTISPDQATITFGYENSNADPAAAQEENRLQMEKIINAVKAEGLGDADIKTVRYRVYHNYSRFTVYNMMQAEIKDIKKTGGIIKAAYDAGANKFWDVRFDIVKRQEAYTDALDLAVKRAREKADRLAADEGRKVVSVVSVEEGTVGNSYYFSSSYSNYVSADSSSGGYTDGSISSGELEISALVNVTYRLN
jgi:uncharacterized protein YggE